MMHLSFSFFLSLSLSLYSLTPSSASFPFSPIDTHLAPACSLSLSSHSSLSLSSHSSLSFSLSLSPLSSATPGLTTQVEGSRSALDDAAVTLATETKHHKHNGHEDKDIGDDAHGCSGLCLLHKTQVILGVEKGVVVVYEKGAIKRKKGEGGAHLERRKGEKEG